MRDLALYSVGALIAVGCAALALGLAMLAAKAFEHHWPARPKATDCPAGVADVIDAMQAPPAASDRSAGDRQVQRDGGLQHGR